MKKIILLCALVLTLFPFCNMQKALAQNELEKVYIGSVECKSYATENVQELWKIWTGETVVPEFWASVISNKNGVISTEYCYESKGELKIEPREVTKHGMYVPNVGSSFTEEEIRKLFETAVYKEAIESYTGREQELLGLLYYIEERTVFVLTSDNIYAITGYQKVWKESLDDLEVCTLKKWGEIYSDGVYADLYANDVLVDAETYMYPVSARVPLRATFEALDIQVEWIQETNTIILGNEIELQFDDYAEGYMSATSIKTGKKVDVADWTPGTRYFVQDDRMYFSEKTMGYLLRNFGYELDMHIPKRQIRIFRSVEDS